MTAPATAVRHAMLSVSQQAGAEPAPVPLWLFGDQPAGAGLRRAGRRSRELAFEARVVCRADPQRGPSASRVLKEPLTVVTARGTVVLPPA